MVERSASDRDIVDRHLKRAWHAFTPAPQLREQVRARLTSSAAASMGALGLGMASKARPDSAWASLQASGKLGALLGVGLLALGMLSGYMIRDSQPEPPRPVALSSGSSGASPPAALPQPVLAAEREPRETELAPPGVAAPPAESAARRARAAASVRDRASTESARARAVAPTDVATAKPSEELALLRRADRAVRTDNAALALALIGELEERYPRSSLLEERRAIELLAYCRAGASDASTRTQRFLREHPQSAYTGRIQELCARLGDRLPAP